MPKAFVRYNIRPLQKLRQEMRDGLKGGGGPIDTMLRQWGNHYLEFCQKRFRVYSLGGGDWMPLHPKTIQQTKHNRIGILRVTSAVYFALFPGQAGNLFHRVNNTIRVGFGGPGRHPGSEATVAQIAIWHNTGTGRYTPMRRILVGPDQITRSQMANDGKMALTTLIRRAG